MNDKEKDDAFTAYYVAIAAAWKEYEDARAPLWKKYMEAKAAALKAVTDSLPILRSLLPGR